MENKWPGQPSRKRRQDDGGVADRDGSIVAWFFVVFEGNTFFAFYSFR